MNIDFLTDMDFGSDPCPLPQDRPTPPTPHPAFSREALGNPAVSGCVQSMAGSGEKGRAQSHIFTVTTFYRFFSLCSQGTRFSHDQITEPGVVGQLNPVWDG